jgi:hypothetical protein
MKKNKKVQTAPAAAQPDGFSPAGKALIWSGAGLVALGFVVLSRADAFGRNWAASLSPFLILGGYALMGLGIFWPASDAPPNP